MTITELKQELRAIPNYQDALAHFKELLIFDKNVSRYLVESYHDAAITQEDVFSIIWDEIHNTNQTKDCDGIHNANQSSVWDEIHDANQISVWDGMHNASQTKED